MWEDFVKYNLIRTTFLKTFLEHNIKAGDNLLPYFLKVWEETGSVFKAWITVKNPKNGLPLTTNIKPSTYEKVKDYKDNWWQDKQILKCLKELFPDMMSSGYDIRNLENDVEKFSPFAIEEFYKIVKGKYYLGYDLDEELASILPYTKDQELLEKNLTDLIEYFTFRYQNFDMSLLCEYSSIPFGVHESRAERYKKTKQLEFEYPKEVYKYPVNEIFDKCLTNKHIKHTRLINIRGTNGSGKTTMVNNIYQHSVSIGMAKEGSMFITDSKDKERERFYDLLEDKKIILLGGYNTPFNTKGTDRLGDAYEIIRAILYLVSHYPGWTIIMESATVSTSFWAYALLYMKLKALGVEINIVHLWMKDWDFPLNNVKNRTERKEGAKEPNYKEILDKREILYKNHLRFASILGEGSCMVMYPDTCEKEKMHINLHEVIRKNTGRGLL